MTATTPPRKMSGNAKATLIITGAIVGLIAVGSLFPSHHKTVSEESVAEQLTDIEIYWGGDIPREQATKRFDSLIQQLVQETGLTEKGISDGLVSTVQLLEKRGIKQDLLQLAEIMNRALALQSKPNPDRLPALLATYVVMRNSGYSQAEIENSIRNAR